MGGKGPALHFAAANGYPPGAYRAFLEPFSKNYEVVASLHRPLWEIPPDIESFKSWDVFGEDICELVGQLHCPVVSVGHSMGTAAILMAAVHRPELFKSLVLIEPLESTTSSPERRASWIAAMLPSAPTDRPRAGAPAWLEPLVNKALKEGTDKTKTLAIADGQIVKSLDTPTGNVDVYYDTRTGAVDIDYIGSGTTAMDEPLQMSYKPGVADEGTKGIKPDDEFSAVESIPEINQSSGNFSGSHKDLEFGENVSNNVEGLYSDTSELAKLGGKNPLIKEISESIQKKKFLKKMNDDPDQFAMENAIDNQYYD